MRPQQYILAGLKFHLVSQPDRLLKLKVLKQRLRELSERVRVGLLLPHDQRQSNRLQSVVLQQRELHTGLIGLRSWLVVGAAQKECSHHVPHQVLTSKLNHVQVPITEVLLVGQHRRKHPICVLGGERKHQRPVQKPAGLMQHAHGALGEPSPNHVLDLTDRGELGALTRFAQLYFASEQAPENLRDQLIVRVGLCAQNLLQNEKVMVCV